MLTFVKHASPFVPLMFMAQEPQMPSLHTPALVMAFPSPDLWGIAHKAGGATELEGLAGLESLPAGSPEGKSGVHLVLDLEKHVQHHGSTAAGQ